MAVLIVAAGCAKEAVSGPNDANKRFMDAWMYVNYPDIQPSGLGIYVLEEKEGEGDQVIKEGNYAIVDYTVTDLQGNISSYTADTTAKRLGKYKPTNYYGPKVWLTMDATIQAGLQYAVVGMKKGGYKKIVIPSWLMTYSTYGTQQEYLDQEASYSNTIYEFTVKDFTDSIDVWQKDSIERYIVKNYGSLDAFSNDTTGFYYRQLEPPVSDKAFSADTTIYINYTGKLLNGLVFDTTTCTVRQRHTDLRPSNGAKSTETSRWVPEAAV